MNNGAFDLEKFVKDYANKSSSELLAMAAEDDPQHNAFMAHLIDCINLAVDEIKRQYSNHEVLFLLTGGGTVGTMEEFKGLSMIEQAALMMMTNDDHMMQVMSKVFLLGAGLALKGEL